MSIRNPPIDPAAVCLRIKTLIAFKEITVAEAAAQCGLKVPTLEGILRGSNMPNSMTLACLSRGLEVSADWLLFGEAPHAR